MKAVVVGSGGWGTALSLVLCDNGHDVTLWSHDPAKAAQMAEGRENSKLKGVRLPEALKISGDLDCLKGAELVISAPPSFAVRETGKKIASYLTPETVLVSVSKGIERDTNLRMSQILTEVTGDTCKVVALSGPSHAEEVGVRQPTGCVSACRDLQAARMVQDAFMNDYFRVYTSEDIVGVELSGAMKNVVALACGVCDGMGYQDNTKALLMTRAMAEIGAVVEGYYAAESIHQLAQREGVDMPICRSIYEVLYHGMAVQDVVSGLMRRAKKDELTETTWL